VVFAVVSEESVVRNEWVVGADEEIEIAVKVVVAPS